MISICALLTLSYIPLETLNDTNISVSVLSQEKVIRKTSLVQHNT